MTIEFALFGIALVLEFLLGGGLMVSMLHPKYRVWPPPKKCSWQYWYIHFSTESSISCFLVLGFLDWNSFFLTHWLRFVFASISIAVGAIIFLWALRTLSFSTSLGLNGKLITEGPYRYSRNPQYVAAIARAYRAIRKNGRHDLARAKVSEHRVEGKRGGGVLCP